MCADFENLCPADRADPCYCFFPVLESYFLCILDFPHRSALDTMKDELENDKSYLSDDYALRGYFFISFVSLYLYYAALNLLRKNGLVGDVSVNELLFELSRVFQVRYSDGSTGLSEIPKRVEQLVQKLGVDILPKK